jgi:gas vesicle protein
MAQKEYPVKDYTRDPLKSEIEKNPTGSKEFVVGAIVGGIVGAATALFMAPKPGKEFRSDINGHAKTLTAKTEGIRQTAIEKGTGLVETAKERTSGITQKVTEKMNTMKSANSDGNNLMDTVKEKAGSVSKMVTDKVSNMSGSSERKGSSSQKHEESEKEGIISLAADEGDFGYKQAPVAEVEVNNISSSTSQNGAEKSSPKDPTSGNKNAAEMRLDEAKKAFDETENTFKK